MRETLDSFFPLTFPSFTCPNHHYTPLSHVNPHSFHYKGGIMPWAEILVAVGTILVTIAKELRK